MFATSLLPDIHILHFSLGSAASQIDEKSRSRGSWKVLVRQVVGPLGGVVAISSVFLHLNLTILFISAH